MSIDRSKRMAFEEVADLFDEARPGYPEALVEDVLALSNMPPAGRILEIGCGPGNATRPYAARGYHITAIEPGRRLAALAGRNLAAFPRVEVVHSSFEEWSLQECQFDLVVSAEAMHWIPPEIGYPKAAVALKPSGAAAFYWNVLPDPQTEWSVAFDDLYRALGMENPERQATAGWLTGIITENFRACASFDTVTVRQYAWSERYTADRYLKILRTYSDLHNVAGEAREKLFAGVRAIIERAGGQVTIPYETVLFYAPVIRT